MVVLVRAYQHGIYPRSEEVVAATRGLERGRVSQDEVDAAFEHDRSNFVATQREAGLDLLSDGLLRWQDIFRPLVEATNGLEARTLVRWFDNNSFFRAPGPTSPGLSLASSVPAVVARDDAVPAPRVATLPSPFMFSRAAQTTGARDALMTELSREILAPVAAALARRGYEVIHLQEPWLTYFGIDLASWDDFEKALTDLRSTLPEGTTLVLHTYFGDPAAHIDRLRNLPVDAVGVDLVETDASELGTDWRCGILAGCLDGRSSLVEPADAVVAMVRDLVERTGAPSLLVSSSCDLELLPTDIARAKVLRLGEISAGLKEELGS
jgi:5-methyltetrahydropteroyltriglutamate--homocysteine methyltransferase